MDKNTQQPVAWVWQFEDGEFYETPHHTKEECERDCCGYDGVAVPCFTTPPMPRDVLMAFGEAVRDAVWEESGEGWNGEYPGNAMPKVDISAIADRYASQVQPDRIAPDVMDALVGNDGGRKPEPVNQQLLAALKGLTEDIQCLIGESSGVYGLHLNGDLSPWVDLEAGGRFERLTNLPDAHAAIAAAEAAQTDHIGGTDKMVNAQQARIAELEKDAARLDFIERMAKQSRTGVGIDWVRHVEDGFVTDHGYRVMWHHTLNYRKRDMRSAIDAAMQK